MTRLRPLQLVVRIVHPKPNTPNTSNTLSNKPKWISFVLGTGLAISETLPFIDNQYNGIIHAIRKIKEEWEK